MPPALPPTGEGRAPGARVVRVGSADARAHRGAAHPGVALESTRPLIIDQPEDNLDSEFIFHSLVPVIRAAKERRQVIVVVIIP